MRLFLFSDGLQVAVNVGYVKSLCQCSRFLLTVLLPVFCSLERKPAKKKVNIDSEDFLNYVIILKSKLCMIL